MKKKTTRSTSMKWMLALAVINLMACKNTESSTPEATFQIKGDTAIIWNSEKLADKIKVSNIHTTTYAKEVVTAGTVQPIPTQFAYIAPPFSGRIIKSYVSLGQKVSAYTPLFEIISPEFTAVQKEYYQAQSERELAQKDLDRKNDLIRNGVGSQKELDEAQSILLVAEKELENARTALEVYHADPENMVLGQPLIVRSPINGMVISNQIITGQYITSDADPIATIADLSKVWITAQVKEKDIRFIHPSDHIEMEIAAYPDKLIKGTVEHVEEEVDEETRSIKVLSVCNNEDGMLKIGMYTTIHFYDKEVEMIEIPESALLQGQKDSFVYVELSPDTFVRQSVEVEASREGRAIIAKGLDTSRRIISEGGYFLK